jgi:SET domain-containing protein
VISDVVVRPAGSKGQGVYALRAFDVGEFIFRRHERVVRNEEVGTLSADDQRHLCELDWETSAVLLPPGCFLNHACEPNAMRSGVNVNAWQPIVEGDEITIDYRLNAFGDEQWACECGSPSCPSVVTSSFFSLAPERQLEYLPYTPPFIRAEYRRRQRQTIAHDD